MKLPKWLGLVKQLAPLILAVTPLAPIVPWVVVGIQTAEGIEGATGAQKLEIAKAIVSVGVAATNAQVGKVILNPAEADTLVAAGISAVVAATNLVHKEVAVEDPL